jgi:hypothetical protein
VRDRRAGRPAAPVGAPSGLLAVVALAAACAGPVQAGGPCVPERPPVLLPPEVPESSGVEPAGTVWAAAPGEQSLAFWTHNDSGWEPVLFLVDAEGGLLARLEVSGARNVDWEDLAAGPCGEGTRCLYVADTGDNLERREDPAIYRIPEPRLDAAALRGAVPAERIPLRFPDGPRDVEALALLADGRGLLVSKGRNHPVEVYRTPVPLAGARPGEVLELERIQDLTDRPPFLPRYVTGAASTPDGSLVVVRTYETLGFYRPDPDGRLVEIAGGVVNLRPLREPQGEAVAFLPGGRLVLTSEAGPGGDRGQMSVLDCRLQRTSQGRLPD